MDTAPRCGNAHTPEAPQDLFETPLSYTSPPPSPPPSLSYSVKESASCEDRAPSPPASPLRKRSCRREGPAEAQYMPMTPKYEGAPETMLLRFARKALAANGPDLPILAADEYDDVRSRLWSGERFYHVWHLAGEEEHKEEKS